MNLARLARMSPDEIRTRSRQELAKRWSKPPACRLIASDRVPRFPDPPAPGPLQQAEKIRAHRFDLLGYENLDFGTPIDWHYDPVHEKRAPRIPWYKVPFLDFNEVGDHKIIWELNRHQHLIPLAQAGFRDEVVAQWSHWQAENPYPIGINWASTLEVAFRALSWLWTRRLLGDFHPDLMAALHLHGWHIEQYLSTYFSPNTHLLGEGVALFAIGTMCPQMADASRWQARGWEIVTGQAERQVRPDGFHFEQSVYYHVYARDFFEFTRHLAVLNGVVIPASLDRTIEAMNEAVAVLKLGGRLPNFGDDDGGRVIVGPAEPREVSPNVRPVGGIYSMTSGSSQLFIDAGPQGAFAAGHGHADSLSIQLIRDGRPILIDSGTFCYVCGERGRFRGTAAHNTLQVDGRDQALSAGPFAWTQLPQTTVDRWHASEVLDLFAGHHDGYRPVTHSRWVVGVKGKFWLVRDVVNEARATGKEHRLDIHWYFLKEGEIGIVAPEGHTWTQSMERTDWSPVYGRKEMAYVLRFSKETTLPAEFAVVLTETAAGKLTRIESGSFRYDDAHGVHELVFGERFLYRVTTADGVREYTV